MADHGRAEYGSAAGNDYALHEGTYQLFVRMAKWGTISVAIILILMAYFLT